MNSVLKILAASAMLVFPLTSNATDTAAPQSAPPQGAPVYPCWDVMQGGHMMPVRGTWHGGPGNMQGNWMMMNAQEVQRMQKEIEDLRKQVTEMKGKQPKK